jgi:parvulin-like peptidyl-prolyl isomerase
MAEARDIERVKLLTGETNENLIEAYLEEAADFVKSYTNRSVIITPLEKAVRDLAVSNE